MSQCLSITALEALTSRVDRLIDRRDRVREAVDGAADFITLRRMSAVANRDRRARWDGRDERRPICVTRHVVG